MALHQINRIALSAGAASAEVIINILETDNNNVLVNAAGLFRNLPIGTYVNNKIGPGIDTATPTINYIIGPADFQPVKAYPAIASQNTQWGSLGFVRASSTSTAGVGINVKGNITDPVQPQIWIPENYILGQPFASSSIYNNTTLKDLGFLRRGLLETYTLVGTEETVIVRTPPALVQSCPTSPTPIAKGGLHCDDGNSLVTLTGGGLTTLSGGTIKFQSGRTSPKSMVPMSISPEGASMTYTDQVGVTSDNVVSFIIEAPTGTPFDPTNLDINVGISDEDNEIIGATQIVEAVNLNSESVVHSISSYPDLPFKSGTFFGHFTGMPAASSGVTSFGVNIYKTPAPLSALGATAAFGFTRKLRRRIQAAG